jgi:deoxyribonuclease V
MEPVRPGFVPDASLSREEMASMQRDIAAAATFADDAESLDRACVGVGGVADVRSPGTDPALVAGVDQAFLDERAVSAVVLTRGGEVVERASAATPTEIPYVPGLLSFREGGSILAAFRELDREPDLALFDGSGRIHFREAGLATHVGVTLDLPAIGVAKRLLCGTPVRSLEGKEPAGTRIAVEADDNVETAEGTTIGYALQTRQFEGGDRYVNPVYVSPGHRVGAGTAADVVERCSAGYKLPEPTRLADRYADEVKAAYA